MLSQLFLGISLVGAEWVLYVLVLLSFISVALMFERAFFFKRASQGLEAFRGQVRAAAASGRLDEAARTAQSRAEQNRLSPDLESEMAAALLRAGKLPAEVLSEVANDSVARHRLAWERNLSILATIGSNSPFIGLFGTVLGIIRAFHDLSQQAGAGASTVTAGISEALVATAVGLLVAIPAVIAFNLFQRRVKSALAEAESLKSFLIGKLAG
jgi:biopolymer transport protein ExbB